MLTAPLLSEAERDALYRTDYPAWCCAVAPWWTVQLLLFPDRLDALLSMTSVELRRRIWKCAPLELRLDIERRQAGRPPTP
jgi:hypothetical protein